MQPSPGKHQPTGRHCFIRGSPSWSRAAPCSLFRSGGLGFPLAPPIPSTQHSLVTTLNTSATPNLLNPSPYVAHGHSLLQALHLFSGQDLQPACSLAFLPPFPPYTPTSSRQPEGASSFTNKICCSDAEMYSCCLQNGLPSIDAFNHGIIQQVVIETGCQTQGFEGGSSS